MQMDKTGKTIQAADSSALNGDAQAASRDVYSVLAQVCGGKAVSIIRQVPRGNGLQRLRRPLREFEPDPGMRTSAMLGGILAPELVPLILAQFVDTMYGWETVLTRYWDTMQVAIVFGKAPGCVRD